LLLTELPCHRRRSLGRRKRQLERRQGFASRQLTGRADHRGQARRHKQDAAQRAARIGLDRPGCRSDADDLSR
jgi:hypothetical protein